MNAPTHQGVLKHYDQTVDDPQLPEFIVVDSEAIEAAGYKLLAEALDAGADIVNRYWCKDGHDLEQVLTQFEVDWPVHISDYSNVFIDSYDPRIEVIKDSSTYFYKGKE